MFVLLISNKGQYIAPNFSAKILTYVSVKKVGNIKLKKNCPTITILIVDFWSDISSIDPEIIWTPCKVGLSLGLDQSTD